MKTFNIEIHQELTQEDIDKIFKKFREILNPGNETVVRKDFYPKIGIRAHAENYSICDLQLYYNKLEKFGRITEKEIEDLIFFATKEIYEKLIKDTKHLRSVLVKKMKGVQNYEIQKIK